MEKPLTLLYFGINPPEKSMRDRPYIAGLKERGVQFLECHDSSSGSLKFWNLTKKFFAIQIPYDAVFVGHTGTTVVWLARLLSRKPIVFNGLCPLYDGMVLERGTHNKYSLRAFLIWLLDFISYHLSTAVLLETDMQVSYVEKHFFISPRKLFRVFTTADPSEYFPDASVTKEEGFLCVFRGWLTPATGAEYIVEAAHILKDEGVRFRFIVRGQSVLEIKERIQEYGLSNVELIEGFHEIPELRQLILSGHVYLGQFGAHKRLDKTIQFKTVEACAFGMPYITADLPSNRELLHDDAECLFVRRADPKDLADKIRLLKNDSSLRDRLGNAARVLFQKRLAPPIIADEILMILRRFIS